VDSFRERLDAISPQSLTAYNDAVSGARAVNLLSQAQVAASQDPELVLIEIGANDACAAPPTPTATFEEQVRSALEVLVAGNKQVYIQPAVDRTGRRRTASSLPRPGDRLQLCAGGSLRRIQALHLGRLRGLQLRVHDGRRRHCDRRLLPPVGLRSGEARRSAWSTTFNDWQHRKGALAHSG
jgi:hypothetical protein